MRLPKHKMSKEASKHCRQVKHAPKKLVKIERKLAKEEKKSKMAVDEEESDDEEEVKPKAGPLSGDEIVQRENAKVARKRVNAHKVHYKKINSSISHGNGPRAVSK